MNILGICGAFGTPDGDFVPETPIWFYHDATACLIQDGKLIAASEEERFNRIKHTTKFPLNAIRYCLEEANLSFAQIDGVAYYFSPPYVDKELYLKYISFPESPVRDCKQLLLELITENFDRNFDSSKLVFVEHHLCHAYSAFYHSGFEKALTVVLDGQGEKYGISVYHTSLQETQPLQSYTGSDSLGHFFVESIKILGYKLFDEYKVMGLAPYGDPSIFRPLFDKLYRLLPNGNYSLNIPLNRIRSFFLKNGIQPRRRGEPFSKIQENFAASLQEALEKIAFHLISHWQKKTGLKNLCMAGGVAHNCTLNGKIACSSLFDKMFVHPAAFDAGAAIGAAMYVSEQKGALIKQSGPIRSIYWGPHIETKETNIEEKLSKWSDLMKLEYKSDIEKAGAKLLAEGSVIGWVQGKMEFGPRALGNRSILADPRPGENKSRINAMIKKREAYRPFAPSILEEEVSHFFELPKCEIDLSFMTYNLEVRKEYQKQLGAITHVNGTGRIQTVSKEQNERYWKLIYYFQKLTGIPLLLNTSFNNNHEPIVCTIEDSIACFLTTGLDYLVVGNYLLTKKDNFIENLLNLSVSLPPHVKLCKLHSSTGLVRYTIRSSVSSLAEIEVSENLYHFLREDFSFISSLSSQRQAILAQELYDCWSYRMFSFQPGTLKTPKQEIYQTANV